MAGVKQSAGAVIGQLAASPRTAAVAAAAKQAFSQATRLTAFTAAAYLALGLLASLSPRPRKRLAPDAWPGRRA